MAIGCRLLAVGCQPSAIRGMAVSGQPSAISHLVVVSRLVGTATRDHKATGEQLTADSRRLTALKTEKNNAVESKKDTSRNRSTINIVDTFDTG